MKTKAGLNRAVGAVGAQVTQALASFALMTLAARLLGLSELGKFSILYGAVVLATAISTGFVGDSLTVLDRHKAPIRSALQRWAMLICTGVAMATAAVCWGAGFLGWGEALVFALAILVFMLEDLLRRLLMASMAFMKIWLVDLSSLVVSMAALATWYFVELQTHSGGHVRLPLLAFLLALFMGQFAALILAVFLLPEGERSWSRGVADMRAVFKYGKWRAAQQGLRPAMQTVTRIVVVAVISLAAAGEFEIARIYSAPVLLVVSGISSFLFASFAGQREASKEALLKQADRGVAAMIAVTIPGSALALFVMPWAGPLVTGHLPNTLAAAGWLVYGISVAAVTPYGALGAVRSNPAIIFAIRSADTLFSIFSVVVVLFVFKDYAIASWAMVPGSILGGLVIRQLIVSRNRMDAQRALFSKNNGTRLSQKSVL